MTRTSNAITHSRRWLHRCVGLGLMYALSAFADPAPFEAEYRLDFKGLPVTAKTTRSLEKHKDGSFLLSQQARSFLGTISETSTFRWDGKQVIPEEYTYTRKGLGRNRDATVRFERIGAPGSKARGNSIMSVDAGVTDALSYQLQMREDLKRVAANGSGQTAFTYRFADGGRVKEYAFEFQGEEVLDTDLGKLRTVRVARVGGSTKRETIVWLAKDWDYLLVRLRQIEKGSGSFDLLLESATVGGKAVTPLAE